LFSELAHVSEEFGIDFWWDGSGQQVEGSIHLGLIQYIPSCRASSRTPVLVKDTMGRKTVQK